MRTALRKFYPPLKLSPVNRVAIPVEQLEQRLLFDAHGSAAHYDNLEHRDGSGLSVDGPAMTAAPAPDAVSRWSGVVRPRSTKRFEFRVPGTDPVRLWVDGK